MYLSCICPEKYLQVLSIALYQVSNEGLDVRLHNMYASYITNMATCFPTM